MKPESVVARESQHTEREFAGTHQALVEALQAIVEITKLPALHPRLSKTTYNELIHHEAEQALRLAQGEK